MWYTDIHWGKIPIHIKCLKMKRNVLCRSNWTALGHVIWSVSAAPVVDFWTQWLCFLPCSDEQMPPNCQTLVLMVWRANGSTHIDYENNGFLLIISPRAARRESWLVLTKQKSPLALSAPLFLSKIIRPSQRWLILCQDPSPHTHIMDLEISGLEKQSPSVSKISIIPAYLWPYFCHKNSFNDKNVVCMENMFEWAIVRD